MNRGTTMVAALFCSYFLYVGVWSPYFSLFLADKGFSVLQIGQLLAVTAVLRIIGPWSWGYWADHSAQPKRLMLLAGLGMIPFVALLHWAPNYALVAALLVVIFFLSSAFGPISESMALAAVDGDPGRYGRLRLFGSIGFLGGVVMMGPILDRLGVASLPVFMVVTMALVCWVCWRLPAPKIALPRHDSSTFTPGFWTVVRRPEVVSFFVASFLMVFSHQSLYTFYSLYLEKLGFSKTAIGLLWGVAVVAEIMLFYVQSWFLARWPLTKIAIACFAVAAIRFFMVGVADGIVWVLFLAQILHSATFALHHSASMGLMKQWFSANQIARAQALFIMATYGLGGTLGATLLARSWEYMGPSSVFLIAAGTSILGLVAMTGSAYLFRTDSARTGRNAS